MDAADITTDFLTQLPDTIRMDVLIFVLLYSFTHKYKPGDDLNDVAANKISRATGLGRLIATVRSVGVIDFVLRRLVATTHRGKTQLPLAAKRAEDFPAEFSTGLQKMALANDLRLRHAEAALRRWEALRADELSPGRLCQFEDGILNPNISK